MAGMAHGDLDDTDHAILELLCENARRPTAEIAKRVSLSPAAVKRRIDRLERAGVITGYTARLHHPALGARIEAFIELRFRGSTQIDVIDRTLQGIPEVVAAYMTAGDPDALVRVRVADLADLKRVIDRIRRSTSITGTKTLIVLGAVGADG
jgi:DNA-binding Lrp family transcriptional regulator